jgi:CRP-like cAMP-binding protein
MNTAPLLPSVALLKEIKLLQCFTDAELSELLKLGEERAFDAYGNIVIEGELSWGLYVILQGTVGVYKSDASNGTAYDIGQLKEGGFFGEMSLIDQNGRSATVRALVPTQCLYFSKEGFNQFLQHSQERGMRFAQSCIQQLVLRLRDLNDHYVISQYQLWKSALRLGDSEAA